MTERSIFIQALEIADASQRASLLDRTCHGDAPLRARVEKLLAAHAAAGGILDQPPVESPPTDVFRSITEGPGTIIGPYKLIQLLGEGGMGVVYMAQQTEPVKRLVALKIIKPGMDSRQVIARFEAERQALALMDHPNIAKVLDAGTTDSGRPYFVMELVKGIPITTYCDEKRLTPRQRLELFIPVCHAVQHAHQKGIVHRDLKPSNVMIALYDGRPVPKVIDFGVAKAAGGQLTEKTLVTSFGSLVGTLEYMSPEQAELNQLDVDTRSDIYSLGVLLYELLTGDTPFDKKRLRSAAFDEMLRIIREEEPPLPSTRLSSHHYRSHHAPGDEPGSVTPSVTNNLVSIAAVRSIDPAKLAGIIRGEIDWIIMKALEKDRSRRYETANGLARDIQRYLADESVEACPPSLSYRLSKISRRYRTPLAVAASFLALLLAGIAVSAWQAIRATSAEAVALAAADAARQAKESEATERARAESNAKAARDNEQLAEEQRDAANREKNNALAAREDLRETLYAAEMNLVQTAVENRQYARAAQLLDEQRPAAGQPDFRGFEWHYWRRRLRHGWLRSVDLQSSIGRVRARTLSFSKGGARLAALVVPTDSSSAVGNALLAIFDGVTGRELLAPFDPMSDLSGRFMTLMTMSDDGTRLAVANAEIFTTSVGQPGRISILDGGTGREIRRLEIPEIVSEIALTADGGRIAVAYFERGEPVTPRLTSQPTGVKIWDATTGELVQTLPILPHPVGSGQIHWSPDGTRLLRRSYSSERANEGQRYDVLFQIVDVASGEELGKREFLSVAYPLRAWSWSPDGKLLVILEPAESNLAAKPNVQLWDSKTGTVLAILDRESASASIDANIDFSPDGQLLAVVCGGNEIYVWEVPKLPLAAGASPLRIAAPHLRLQAGVDIMGLAFKSTGRELVSVDAGTSIVTWDAAAREEGGLGSDLLEGSRWASISPDTTKVAFGSGGFRNPSSGVWDLATNQEAFRVTTAGVFNIRPAFSADGRRVALVKIDRSSQEKSQIVIHDSQTGEALTTIQLDQPDLSSDVWILSLVFRPDGRQIAALVRVGPRTQNRGPAKLMVWDAATAKQLPSVPVEHASMFTELHYSQDGLNLIVGATDRLAAVVFYDATTGEKRRSIPLPSSERSSFIDPRHQRYGLMLGSDFVVGDLATGHERLRLPGYHVDQMAISPDGSRLALGKSPTTTTGASEVSLWSMKSGRRLLAFNRPGNVAAVAFSPDGNRLVAAFYQLSPRALKPIQIWDATPLPEESAK